MTDELTEILVTREGDVFAFGERGYAEHRICGGFVIRRQTATMRQALLCVDCGLRATLPVTARTVEEIRQHFASIDL